MATHHSKTGRTKSPDAQIVVPSWDKVWASFEEHNTKTTVEAMNAEGWKTVDQVIQKTKLSNSRIYNMIRQGFLESVKKKIYHAGKTRDSVFVRPLSPSQS
jgi:hypothetical protein